MTFMTFAVGWRDSVRSMRYTYVMTVLCQVQKVTKMPYTAQSVARFGNRKGTPKNLCDKDFAEFW